MKQIILYVIFKYRMEKGWQQRNNNSYGQMMTNKEYINNFQFC